jgi:membrane protein required for colicin V production
MLIDILVLVLLVMALFKGLRNGLIIAVFSLLAFMIGLAAALKLSAVAADYLGKNSSLSGRWVPVLAFLLVFIAVVLLVRLGAKMLEKVLSLAMMGWLNKIGGVLFYVLLYLFIFSIVLFYATQLKIIQTETAQVSISYPYLYPLAPKVMEGLGVVLPFFKNSFAQLEAFFDGLAHH